jgi:hypothetical protein
MSANKANQRFIFSRVPDLNNCNSLKVNLRGKAIALQPRKASRFKIGGLRFYHTMNETRTV